MKTMILSTIAAAFMATTVSADTFDNTVLVTTVTTGNLEFSASTTVGDSVDNYLVGGGATFDLGKVGTMDSKVFVFGQYANVATVGVAAVGAEYTLSQEFDRTTVELTGQAAYVALTEDFGNGDLFVTPSANVEYAMTDRVAVFGEVGYTWNATNDFHAEGGYGQVGLDVGLTDTVGVRPSIVKPFDSASDDAFAVIELKFNF